MNAWPRFAPAALLFAACAAAPDLRYASDDPADTWDSGVRWHASESRNLRCGTAYAGTEANVDPYPSGQALVFQVHIGNQSDSSIRVDPLDFQAIAALASKTFPAADPETVLAAVDQNKRNVDAAYGTNLAIEGGLAVGMLVTQIAAIGSDDRARAKTYAMQDESGRRRNEEEDRYQSDLAYLKDMRLRWEQGHLRRTDLAPGRSLAGVISIPFPAEQLPPDTLVLRWTPPGRPPFDVGRYGRPRRAADSIRPRLQIDRPQNGFLAP